VLVEAVVSDVDPAPDRVDLARVVRAAGGGDQDAVRALYRAVQPGLLRYLLGLVSDDAEDVASEARRRPRTRRSR
jgi:RNA polymerase sigma-70 factor (ECF subfamily)